MHCFSQPKSEKVWKRPPAARVAQLLHLAAKRKLVDSFRSLSGLGTCSLSQLVPTLGAFGGSERMPRAEMRAESAENLGRLPKNAPSLGLFPLSESTSHTRAPGTGEEFTSDAPLDAGQGAGREGGVEAPSFLLLSPPSATADTTKLPAPGAHRAEIQAR